jgi:AMMECR1 domain-containing protein
MSIKSFLIQKIRNIENRLLLEQQKILFFWDEEKRTEAMKSQKVFQFGLDDAERLEVLRATREMIERAIRGEMIDDQLMLPGSRFDGLATLDVTLWVKGRFRGSRFGMQKPFRQALHEASIRAIVDPRFKPIVEEELPSARIEIILMSLEHTPLSLAERKKGSIDPKRGYRLWYAGREGWYLPGVFNCIRFRSFHELLESLALKKAMVSPALVSAAVIETFAVEDFIESADYTKALSIVGPTVQTARQGTSLSDEIWQGDLEKCLRNAVEQLLRIQEPDGNISPIIDALSGREKQIDWSRLMFTAEVLVLAGRTLGDERLINAASKASEYVERHMYDNPIITAGTMMAAAVYHAKMFFALGRTKEALARARKVSEMIDTVPYRPIAFLQAASFFSLFDTEKDLLARSEEIFERCHEDYSRRRKAGENIELALFPEAIPVAWRLFQVTGQQTYKEKALKLEEWFISQQLPNGSFPSRTGGTFDYTRGTGKIFEALAFRPKENEQALLRTFQWLENMQYSKENSYFIDEKYRHRLLGGFRHDALDQDAWIDAAAHVVLGGIRILDYLRGRRK